ncbi:MAG: hypothetical protein GY854_13755 [Deltaproteobacteria bacterium]|nr:hypothetical protein [Deltaproteobacteria bacterium]
MLKKMILIVTIATLTSLVISACTEEEIDYCEEYCDVERECATYNNQKSSTTECMFYCKVELERHESIQCDYRWEDYLECKTNLSCSEWGNDGKRCANEIDGINSCSGSGS